MVPLQYVTEIIARTGNTDPGVCKFNTLYTSHAPLTHSLPLQPQRNTLAGSAMLHPQALPRCTRSHITYTSYRYLPYTRSHTF